MDIVQHRPLVGVSKTCSITKDVDQWFVTFVCEVDVPDPVHPHPEAAIALDRGVTNIVADSDGVIVQNPAFGAKAAKKLAKAQRDHERKKKGSKNQAKSAIKVARIHRKVRRQREAFLHQVSARYAKSHGVIVLEDLNIRNMIKSASGTEGASGSKVAQKRSLSRSILDAGWGKFARFVDYKSAGFGGRVVEVPAAYSSQECAACGHISPKNRPSQAVFKCEKCGHHDHADVNAAKVILARGLKIVAVESAVQVCGGVADVRRPAKQKERLARVSSGFRKKIGNHRRLTP